MSERTNLRIKEETLEVIKRAAKIAHKPYTSFMVAASLQAAEEIIEKHGRTVLGGLEWETFVNRLNEKPKTITSLKKLLNKKPLWEK